MKLLLVILLLIIGVLAYVFFAPSDASNPTEDTRPATTQTRQPQTEQSTQQPRGGSLGAGAAGVTTDVGDVVNYGIGATQLKVKKHSQDRIKDLNEAHNKSVDESLNR